MEVTVNGKGRNFPDDATAKDLLNDLGLDPRGVVVEVNLSILKRDSVESHRLRDGDQIEILRFVGGG